MPCGALHHLSSVMHPHREACELLSEPRNFAWRSFLILQSLAAAPLQPRGAAVQPRCNGTLCGLRARWRWLLQKLPHEKRFCSVISWRIGAQLSRRLQRRIVQQIKQAGLGRIISDFILSWGPSFISDIYSWIGAPPSPRPLGSRSALRPHQPLWKNPVHLTCIAWLHLCVLFGPCRWRRRAGQLPAAAPRPIWCHPPAPP